MHTARFTGLCFSRTPPCRETQHECNTQYPLAYARQLLATIALGSAKQTWRPTRQSSARHMHGHAAALIQRVRDLKNAARVRSGSGNTRRAGHCLGNRAVHVGQWSEAHGTAIDFFVCGAQRQGNSSCRLRLLCGCGSAVCSTNHRSRSIHPYMLRRYKSVGVTVFATLGYFRRLVENTPNNGLFSRTDSLSQSPPQLVNWRGRVPLGTFYLATASEKSTSVSVSKSINQASKRERHGNSCSNRCWTTRPFT